MKTTRGSLAAHCKPNQQAALALAAPINQLTPGGAAGLLAAVVVRIVADGACHAAVAAALDWFGRGAACGDRTRQRQEAGRHDWRGEAAWYVQPMYAAAIPACRIWLGRAAAHAQPVNNPPYVTNTPLHWLTAGATVDGAGLGLRALHSLAGIRLAALGGGVDTQAATYLCREEQASTGPGRPFKCSGPAHACFGSVLPDRQCSIKYSAAVPMTVAVSLLTLVGAHAAHVAHPLVCMEGRKGKQWLEAFTASAHWANPAGGAAAAAPANASAPLNPGLLAS